MTRRFRVFFAMQTAFHQPNFKHRTVFAKFAAVSPVSVGPSERSALTCSLFGLYPTHIRHSLNKLYPMILRQLLR